MIVSQTVRTFRTVSNDLTMGATTLKKKAPPAPSVVPAKRARQQSLSPPEDPSNASLAIQPQVVSRSFLLPTVQKMLL